MSININGLYQHYKGNFYIVVGIGMHTETGEELVCYREATVERYWFRPAKMWEEQVMVNGRFVPRFKKILATDEAS
jgi:hypothetical protein